MSTIVYPAKYSQPSRFPILLLLLLFVFAVSMIVIATPSLHAIEKHGSSAVAVRTCMNDNGPIQKWTNAKTGRDAFICQIEKNKFGIQIVKDGEEITAFIKEKISVLEKVEKYLQNAGYHFVE